MYIHDSNRPYIYIYTCIYVYHDMWGKLTNDVCNYVHAHKTTMNEYSFKE